MVSYFHSGEINLELIVFRDVSLDLCLYFFRRFEFAIAYIFC